MPDTHLSRRLAVAVFLCGAVVMAFEIAGSRILAPGVGTSLTAWTALIGTVLASLAAGYWLGGRMADHDPSPLRLATCIAAAACAIAMTGVLGDAVMTLVAAAVHDIRSGAVIAALLLFAPAAVLLGTVTPWAAKLSIRDLATDGATIGTLAALSTAGSIAGTFLAGFVLIGSLGTAATLAVLAAVAAGSALLVHTAPRTVIFSVLAGAVAVLAVLHARDGGTLPTTVDTGYQRIRVFAANDPATGRPVVAMTTDPFGVQAARFPGSDEPVFSYIRFFRVGEELRPAPKRALLIGGAAYTWPRDFLSRNPGATITVAELDPGMTAVAGRFFEFRPDPRIRIVHQDGRIVLNRENGRYDLMFMDAFSGSQVPFQLLTREAAARAAGLLAEDGVMLVNLIGALEGERAALVHAAARTFGGAFPYVRLFGLGASGPAALQNVILLAAHRNLDVALARVADPLGRGPLVPWHGVPDGIILTDDHAPVERLSRAALGR